MEFNEKLKTIRMNHKLTQEQLSQKLHISRTAVSKWESGRGFPNIEALKNISKLFNMPIDQLLSGEELLDAAEYDNTLKRNKTIGLVFGINDFMFISFLFLPLFGERVGDYIHSVNLLQWNNDTWTKTVFYTLFIIVSLFGLIEIILHFFDSERLQRAFRTGSLLLHSMSVILFIAVREPYVNFFLFLLLLSKIILLIRKP